MSRLFLLGILRQIFNRHSLLSSKFCWGYILEWSRLFSWVKRKNLGKAKFHDDGKKKQKKKWFRKRLTREGRRVRAQRSWGDQAQETARAEWLVMEQGKLLSKASGNLAGKCPDWSRKAENSRKKIPDENRWNNWALEKELRIRLRWVTHTKINK